MTKEQIESVLDRVRTWPAARQEDAAQVLLAMEAQDLGHYCLSDDERADIEAALEEVERDEVASDAEVAVVFNRRRR
jgi:hypothetical protein